MIYLAGDASVFTWPQILSYTASAQNHYQHDGVFTVHLQGACSPFSFGCWACPAEQRLDWVSTFGRATT